MTTMTHEGYVAEIELDEDAGLLSGVVVKPRAPLRFAARAVEELRRAFAETIADYREWRRERGVEPEKPYSGTLSLRIAPELHRRIAEKAAQSGESINQFIAHRLEEVA